MSITLLDPGLATFLVDGGRPRTRELGVPLGGAADRATWMLGNALLGNDPCAAALEFALKGPRLRAKARIAAVIVGSPFEANIKDREIPMWTTLTLAAGEELVIGKCLAGMRGYLCVAGGLQGEVMLGSQSSLEPLIAGTVLACRAGDVGTRFVPELQQPRPSPVELRVLAGAQADWFPKTALIGPEFVVSSTGNRMGVRLESPLLPPPEREMVSEPVAPGAVQVTREGQAIILGVDGQTIGGYPKIAHVIDADLDMVGQLRPGDRVQFHSVSLLTAEAASRARHAWLREWVVRLRLAAET